METGNRLDDRIGARKVSNRKTILDGFSNLCTDVATYYNMLLMATSNEQAVEAFNLLAPRCLSIFTIGCAGRGNNSERINAASVLVSDIMFVLDDKLTDGEKTTRVLPHTSLTRSALKIYLSAREIIVKRLNLSMGSATSPLFCAVSLQRVTNTNESITSGDFSSEWKVLEAADLTQLAKDYFKADLNFQRHEFVTDLSEALVNRWLIRVLTGHGSHLTHAFSHPQNVAPIEGIRELAIELEKSYPRVIGRSQRLSDCAESISFRNTTPLLLPLDIKPNLIVNFGNAYSSAEILPQTDRQCLIDWKLVSDVRSLLAVGDMTPTDCVPTLVSLLVHTGVPTVEIALDFCCGSRKLFSVGRMQGLTWSRRHCVHDIWLPMQKPTLLLISQIPTGTKFERNLVIADTARWLRSIAGYSAWSKSDPEVLKRFSTACERWRRIELPPSLCMLASPHLETACLSPESLQRLAEPKSHIPCDIGSLARAFLRPAGASVRNHNLEGLGSILNKARERKDLGGQIARAQFVVKEIELLDVAPTSIFNFSKNFILRECSAIVEGLTKGRISTLSTRWSTLHPTLNEYPQDFEFEDLEEDDFNEFTDKVNAYCLKVMRFNPTLEDKKYYVGNGKERTARARDALQRLFRNLQRDGWDISSAVWENIGGATVHYPRLSASSTLVLPAAISKIASAAKAVFSDHPRLAKSLLTKVSLMSKFPMRIGEASTVPMHCVTDCGEIAVCITPFATDKSGHSPRVWPIDQKLVELLDSLSEQQSEIEPSGKWLYRFDDRAADEDQIVNQQIGVLLRWATGDQSARPHALRGVAYQNILWPGWIDFSTEYLSKGKNSFECYRWIHRQSSQTRWTLPAHAMQAAGHGAVDPGFQAYAAAWPIIYSIHLTASLSKSQPSDFWRSRLGIKPNTMVAAKNRKPENEFDRWYQLARAVDFSSCPPLFTPPNQATDTKQTSRLEPKVSSARSIAFNKVAGLRYLTLLAMNEKTLSAERDSGLTATHSSVLKTYLPSTTQIDIARKRKKSTILGKALSGDIDFVKGDVEIAKWIAALGREVAIDLRSIFNRDGDALPNGKCQVRDPSFWMRLVKDIPANLCLSARFGRGRHLELSEEQKLKEIGPSFVMGDRDRDLGQMPEVMLSLKANGNPVDSRHRTAVVKLYLLMHKSIEAYQLDHHDSARKPSPAIN